MSLLYWLTIWDMNECFVGKSGMGPRGDAILEADWEVGQLLDELERLDSAQNGNRR